MADNDQVILAFSIIIASLLVSGSVFFAAGSLNNNLTALVALGNTSAGGTTGGTVQQQVQQPTQQQPDIQQPDIQQPALNLSMKELVQKASFSKGDPKAPVVMAEVFDYQCPFCRRFFDETYGSIKKDYIDSGKVLYIVFDFPLPFHTNADEAAIAARCAGEQGKYFEMHDLIYAKQQEWSNVSAPYTNFKQYALELKLDSGKFNSCVDSEKYRSNVDSDYQFGQQLGVTGTPSFVIGKASGSGQLLVGAQPYATFKAALDSALS